MKSNFFIITFTILSIISFLILPTKSQNNFTYEEPEGLGKPNIFSIHKYNDNKIVVRIIRADASVQPSKVKLCLQKYLSLRTIYPDGHVVPVNIALNIQPFNFCLLAMDGLKSPINVYPIRNNFLLVTYTEAQDINDPYTYIEMAMIVDLDGNIKGNVLFGPADVNVTTNEWLPGKAAIQVNFNPDKGFIRYAPINTSGFIWQQYSVDENGDILIQAEDIVYFPGFLSSVAIAIPMVDGRYAIVYANSTDSGATLENPFKTQGGIYVIILEYGKVTEREPAILYQTSTLGLNFTNIDCDINYVGVGQTCIVTGDFTDRTAKKKFYIKVDFLSTGAVYNVTPLRNDVQTFPAIDQYNLQSLPYGGYLLSGKGRVNGQIMVAGYIFNDNGEIYSWNLKNPIATYLQGATVILRNNTYVLAQSVQDVEKRGWALITTDLYKFEEERDHGYNNFHIDTTIPKNNVTIKSNETTVLKIKYYKEVDLSDGHIIVYQDDGNIRQNTSGIDQRYVYQSEDGTTVFVKIIECAFNRPGNYYVSISDNFVKSRIYQEPLYGVKERVWYIVTDVEGEEKNSGDVAGQVQLTTDGTSYFLGLSDVEKKIFHSSLIQELADAIPVSLNRITTNEGYQTDTIISPKQILLSIDIKKDKTKNERIVSMAIKDLDNLIRNKPITVIASGEASRYLDESFGYYQLPNRWKTYGSSLIAVGVIACILIGFFIFTKIKNKNTKAKNTAIFQVAIVIFDIVMDVLFIIKKASDIEELYIPSIVIFIVPFIISLLIAFIIIKKEEKHKEFFEWSRDHKKVVEIFTILAGSDVEVLTVLESNLTIGKFNTFDAKFSKEALSNMFLGSCFNVFFEDIPQIVIQIIYFRKVVHYDAIPLLTLMSSSLTLLSNIIGRLYRFRDHGKNVYKSFKTDEKSNEISDKTNV